MSITTYKIDAKNCFMFALSRDSKGDREVLVEPPEAPAGHVAHWVTDLHPTTDAVTFGEPGTGTWELVEDHRKDKLYLTADGSPYTIDSEINGQTYTGVDVLPAWLTATARPSGLHTWQNGAWALSLALAQVAQIAQLTSDCAAQIVAGFTSSALGSVYTYPSQSIDQQNMVQTAASSAGGSLMCAKAGTWALTEHTQAQAQQVLKDFITARDTPRTKLQTLIGDVNTATVATVQTIVW